MTPDDKSERGSIFRDEALAQREAERGPGGVLRIAPKWATAAFYLLVAFLALGVLAGTLIRIERKIPGVVASTDVTSAAVIVPASTAGDLGPGIEVSWEGRSAEVTAVTGVMSPDEIEAHYGTDVAVPSIGLETSEPVSNEGATAQVVVDSEPAIVALVPGLESLFGD